MMKFKLKSGDTQWAAKGLFMKGNLILIVKPTGSKGRYDIPGGKIKIGESREQGVYRECFEELALKIKSAEFLGENNSRKKCYFKITKWSGKIILQAEELDLLAGMVNCSSKSDVIFFFSTTNCPPNHVF